MFRLLFFCAAIPAGVLQGIYFSSDRPSYLNYGGIGSIIGHEITHGFDDVGSEFGKNGNIVDWWDPATKANFDERAECILNQYNNYIVKLDGKNVSRWLIELIINQTTTYSFIFLVFEGDQRWVQTGWEPRRQWRFETSSSCLHHVGTSKQTGTIITGTSLYTAANVLDKQS